MDYAPTPHKFCPLTHYGDLPDGRTVHTVAFSAYKGFEKNLTKNF